ncbi:MAG TPA: hypothetical protein VFT66_10885 [Roseiflexaceae bacterium]|jgi:hypothetical protein|nr:hypothetical protein [Roseiflexaceae bacterium]
MKTLLAVDLGIRSGLALYGADGRLQWYRSHNFGTATRLRRGVYSILNDIANLQWMILEGGGNLATIWEHEAERRSLHVRQVYAEQWRQRLMLPREQRSGQQAKDVADALARRVIAWSAAPRPTSLRHDAAEAILVGLWGVLELGWLPQIPPELR